MTVATLVGDLARPLRRRAGLASAAAGAAGALAVLGAAAWLARLGVLQGGAALLAAWLVAIACAAAAWVRWRRRAPRWDAVPFAAELEQRGAARRGALTALLESPVAGTSDALHAEAARRAADAVRASAPEALAPVEGQVGTSLRRASAALVLACGLLLSARPMQGAAARLWHPLAALAEAGAPVRLEADALQVARGDSVTLTLSVRGRAEADLWLRAPGESWRPTRLRLDSTGTATFRTGPLGADLYAHATSAGATSDTLQIVVRLPAYLAALGVTARYPAYLRLEDEPMPLGGDTLLLPAGTVLETRGEATAALAAAAWSTPGDSVVLDADGTRFAGRMQPERSGPWQLLLRTADGGGLAGDPVILPIRLLPDAVPQIEVPVPGADTVASPGLELPIVADARDDHGLTSLVLEARRISAQGRASAPIRLTLALPPGTPDRAIVPSTLRLAELGALAGDTVRFRVLARDNAPTRQAGSSREYVIRVATVSELRAQQREASDRVAAALDSLAALGEQLERTTEDLAQEAQRGEGARDGQTDQSLSYEQAKKAEAVVEQQRQLQEKAEQAREAIRELQQGAEAAGLRDSALQKQLEDVRRQLDKALSPEIKQKLAELQQGLKELDGERTQEAMKELAKAQQELREALERARELFERAALEGELESLAQESKDLAKEQREQAERMLSADSAASAAAEQQLAARADSLAAALQEAAEQMPGETGKQELQQAAKQAEQAADKMQQAAQQAKKGERQQAKENAEAAAEQLEQSGEQVDEEKQRQQQEWRQEVTKALDRALAETSRLIERQLGVQRDLRRAPGASARTAQSAVEEGTGRLVDQLRALAGKNALVPPGIAVALATAQQAMGQAREAVSTANANPREASERAGEAVDALNAAAYQMIRARGNVANSQSGSGLSEAMQQMAQMAQQQGAMGQQSAGMLPQMGGGSMGEQLKQLGAQQRAMAERLEKLRGQANVPGAGAMAEEAKEIARALEAQRLDRELVERQERLFKRMLDAGRTLQGTETDEQKERESTAAKPGELRLPPELRGKLGQDDERLRLPSWEELQQLSPEERRLVADYFRRLAAARRQP